jgi:hypothetical protein
VAPVVPAKEPTRIVAGDTVKWTKSLGDFPPSEGWTLKYSFRGQSSHDVTASVVGSEYQVAITPAQSVTLEPGKYTLAGYVEGSGSFAGEQHEVYRDVLVVEPSVEDAMPVELQTQAEKNLAAIEAVIAGRVTHDIESYAIAGRQVTKIPIGELLKLRNHFAAQVRRERNPGRFGRNVGVEFARPS